jgi:hypothetical protein
MINLKLIEHGIMAGCLVVIFLEGCSSDKAPDPVDCNANPVNIQSITSAEATCGIDNGKLTISANGGSGDFIYSINGTDFQPSNIFENLGAGNYTVTVKDVNECSITGLGMVESSSGLMMTVDLSADAGCDTGNGILSVDVTGGEAPYQYRLDNGSFQDTPEFSGLAAGSYTLTAQDVNGCLVTTIAEVINGTSLMEDVMPVITANCAVSGCHDGKSGIPDWSDQSMVIANAANIKTRTGNGTMPPGDRSITDEEIQTIACWVDDGAEDN